MEEAANRRRAEGCSKNRLSSSQNCALVGIIEPEEPAQGTCEWNDADLISCHRCFGWDVVVEETTIAMSQLLVGTSGVKSEHRETVFSNPNTICQERVLSQVPLPLRQLSEYPPRAL